MQHAGEGPSWKRNKMLSHKVTMHPSFSALLQESKLLKESGMLKAVQEVNS